MRYLAIACVSVVLAFAASSRNAMAAGMEVFPKDAEFVAQLESSENAFILSARTVHLPLTEVLYYEAKVWDAVEQDVVTVYISLDSAPLSSADIQVFRQAERQAFALQYGVVEPALKSLVDTVQLATPDALFGVVVWLQQPPSERLDKGLIQLSPAWLQEEVDKRKAALMALQTDAISAIYSALGIEAVPVEGIPAVVATVSADDLAILGSLPQVGRVMYADGSASPNGAGDPLIYKDAVNGWTGYYGDGIWGQVPVCIMDSCGVHVDTELDVGEVAFPPGTPGACFTQHQTWMAELVRQVSAWPYGIAGNVVGQSSIGAKHYIANWDGGNWQFQLGGMAGMDEWCSDREVVVRNNAYTFIYAGYEDDIPSPADKFKDYTVVHPPYATQVRA